MVKSLTLTARMDNVEAAVAGIDSKLDVLLAAFQGSAPAKTVPAKKTPAKKAPAKAQPKAVAAKDEAFVGWLRETAEARKARQGSNREMAAWLRSKNLPTNGPVWDACKAGERSVAKLRKIAA